MLYDPSRAGNATPDLFESAWWRARGSLQEASRGRGEAFFVSDGEHNWVLRHYRRGGLVARMLADRYLWTGEERTRPFREWRLLHDMRAKGLPVPAPIAARYRRDGLMYRGDLITERLIGARSLSELLALAPLPPFAWESVGRCIRAFHEGGYCHADLNAHNVLIDGDGRVHLIDFDRGRQRAPGGWRERNLARLRRSLDKIAAGLPAGRVGSREWDSLVRGYETPPRNPS